MSALHGVRVVDLGEGVAGQFCGKLLADFGADVIKVERPVAPARPEVRCRRRMRRWRSTSAACSAYLNTNKASCHLDLQTPEGLGGVAGASSPPLTASSTITTGGLAEQGVGPVAR